MRPSSAIKWSRCSAEYNAQTADTEASPVRCVVSETTTSWWALLHEGTSHSANAQRAYTAASPVRSAASDSENYHKQCFSEVAATLPMHRLLTHGCETVTKPYQQKAAANVPMLRLIIHRLITHKCQAVCKPCRRRKRAICPSTNRRHTSARLAAHNPFLQLCVITLFALDTKQNALVDRSARDCRATKKMIQIR